MNLIHGDCLEVMKSIPDGSVDLCLTDPPYGIGINYNSYVDSDENWKNLMSKALPEILRISKMAILPSCQIKKLKWFYDNFPPDWIICWYKGSPGHASYIGFNDWEPHLVYGRRINRLYMHDFFQSRPSEKRGKFGHPCPKPIEWSDWLISRVARKEKITVMDPFMGSGTTGLSCKKFGHKFIGIEKDDKYFDIAKARIGV